MRPSKFTEAEMRQALQQVKCGSSAISVCRDLGITQTTFYRWRSKYEGTSLEGLRELRELRVENLKLKQIVAELLLDRQRAAEPRSRE